MRCFWTLGGEPAPVGPDEPVLPDGSPELIFNLGDPFEHIAADGSATRQPAAFLVGQITGPFHVRPTGQVDLIAVRFEAHGAALLHDNLEQVTNRWVAVAQLADTDASGAAARVRAAGSRARRIAAITAWLTELMRGPRAPDAAVGRAVAAIRASRGAVRLDALAAELGIVPRTLQRRFGRQVGIPPKVLARIVRFQAVFKAWREDQRSVGRVAAECGYADHAHLVRDFRELAGEPPARMLAGMPGFTSLFTQ